MSKATSKLRIVFAGTPEFAVPALQGLLKTEHDVVAVYTQPDRPAGRGRKTRASPVKQCALQANIPVYQPLSLRDSGQQLALAELRADLMLVVAYGLLLPAAVLVIPRLGCVNIHASLLPRWRGAAPIQRALLAGDQETGISIMQMEPGLDTGPVLALQSCAITETMTAGELHDALAQLGAQTLLELLPALATNSIKPQPQDDTLACYAAKLDKAEAELDWSQTAVSLARKVRAFNPWPIAQTHLSENSLILRIWRAQAQGDTKHAQPGLVLQQSHNAVVVATGVGELCITELQLPGRRALAARDFVNAHDLQGTVLGATVL